MNETEAIEFAIKLSPLERLKYYMNYWINCYPFGQTDHRKTFEQFCSENNILKHDAGVNWKERGFASQQWINLSAGSLFHSVYHNMTLI